MAVTNVEGSMFNTWKKIAIGIKGDNFLGMRQLNK